MEFNLENRMSVNEVKGLLEGLVKYVKDVKYDLSCDNLDELTDRTNEMRQIIDRIDQKVIAIRIENNRIKDKDDLY